MRVHVDDKGYPLMVSGIMVSGSGQIYLMSSCVYCGTSPVLHSRKKTLHYSGFRNYGFRTRSHLSYVIMRLLQDPGATVAHGGLLGLSGGPPGGALEPTLALKAPEKTSLTFANP